MTEEKQMISVWAWVGIILLIYGAIVTGSGVYYAIGTPATTVLGELNPGAWWGCIMLVSGLALWLIGRRSPG